MKLPRKTFLVATVAGASGLAAGVLLGPGVVHAQSKSEPSRLPAQPAVQAAGPDLESAATVLTSHYEQLARTYNAIFMLLDTKDFKDHRPAGWVDWHSEASTAETRDRATFIELTGDIGLYNDSDLLKRYNRAVADLEPAIKRQNKILSRLILMLNDGKEPARNRFTSFVAAREPGQPASQKVDPNVEEPDPLDFFDPAQAFPKCRQFLASKWRQP